MKERFCEDERCLYYNAGKTVEREFVIETTQTREGEGLWERCAKCGIVINRSGIDVKKVEDFYNSTYVEDNSYSQGEVQTAEEHFISGIDRIRDIADFLLPHMQPSMRVFELGAATGELLYILKDHVAYCMANEINESFVEFIQSSLEIDATASDYHELDIEGKFECILCIGSLDHMWDVLGTVEKIYSDLKPGGFLYIEVPNDRQALKEFLLEPQKSMFRKFVYQKAHYYSFSSEALKRLLSQVGFQIEKEMTRHDYTINNYLHWYFKGKPQGSLHLAMRETDIHVGHSPFEKEMNELFHDMDKRFREIMKRNCAGEALCVLARKPGGG